MKQAILKISYLTIFLILVAALYLNRQNSLFIPLIILAGGMLMFSTLFNRKRKKDDLPELSASKKEHYQKLGLSEQETVFFRETMATVKKQILTLEKNMTQVAKLQAINLRHQTVTAAKAMFKELVKEPSKLHEANLFLYKHLPNLVDLSSKYIEINQHELKTQNTYTALNKSAEVIDQVASLIAKDYELFVADDMDDLDMEIRLAKENLKAAQELNDRKNNGVNNDDE